MFQTYACIQYTVIHNTQINLSTVKWAQWDKTQSRELLGLFNFICVCIARCTIVAHNIAQNRPYNFPLYPPDNHHCSDDIYLREGGRHLAIMHVQDNPLCSALKQEETPLKCNATIFCRDNIIHWWLIYYSSRTYVGYHHQACHGLPRPHWRQSNLGYIGDAYWANIQWPQHSSPQR